MWLPLVTHGYLNEYLKLHFSVILATSQCLIATVNGLVATVLETEDIY